MEAAGVERELAGFFKYLMVLDFWANSRHINYLGTPAVFTAVPSNLLISTVFLEKIVEAAGTPPSCSRR